MEKGDSVYIMIGERKKIGQSQKRSGFKSGWNLVVEVRTARDSLLPAPLALCSRLACNSYEAWHVQCVNLNPLYACPKSVLLLSSFAVFRQENIANIHILTLLSVSLSLFLRVSKVNVYIMRGGREQSKKILQDWIAPWQQPSASVTAALCEKVRKRGMVIRVDRVREL